MILSESALLLVCRISCAEGILSNVFSVMDERFTSFFFIAVPRGCFFFFLPFAELIPLDTSESLWYLLWIEPLDEI